jgi:hypothetical protein
LELTNPATIPEENEDPIFFPAVLFAVNNGSTIVTAAINQVKEIISGSGTNCSKCISSLKVGQYVAQRVPQLIPDMLVELCMSTKFRSNSSCRENYEAQNYGAVWTQVLSLANVSGSDGQYICNFLSSDFCPRPYTLPSDTTAYFGPKPNNPTVHKPSGKRVKVLHMSDMHIDPRYEVGSEANCTGGMCCRPQTGSTSSEVQVPAPLYGAFKCDSPYFLLTAALESVAPLTGTTHNNRSHDDQFAFGIYTGDLVSHEGQNELSRNYTLYAEWSIYHMLKAYIPSGPIFPVLGNHDTNPGKMMSCLHAKVATQLTVGRWN